MEKISIKARVTLWYVIFLVIILALVLLFIFSVGENILRTDTKNQLKTAVERSAGEIEWEDGYPEIDDDVSFYANGIYLSFYDEEGDFLFGRLPEDFRETRGFEVGNIQTAGQGESQWYIYDYRQQKRNKYPIYIRGIASASQATAGFQTTIFLALIALPFIVVIATIGGYIITKQAFSPIHKIVNAAEQIGGGDDLTQRINLGQGNDEIYSLAAVFDTMFARLQQSFEKEKQFTADVSHELRTPTTVIITQCEYALEHAKNKNETDESLQVVLGQAKKMSRLISQLLMMARADAGEETLQMESVNLSELTMLVAEEQSLLAEENQLTIHTDILPDIQIKADQTMIIRLLINLISNAISYSNPGGHITITITRENGFAHGMVADTGIGISEENLPRIWNRFFQADASRSPGKKTGAGLGLSMVKWIAEQHGGSVFAESQMGTGSTFHFYLPLESYF